MILTIYITYLILFGLILFAITIARDVPGKLTKSNWILSILICLLWPIGILAVFTMFLWALKESYEDNIESFTEEE